MSLSNSVKTHYLDPEYHSITTKKSTFKLDQTFINSDMYLVNVGVYDPQRTNVIGLYYPTFNGVLQSIKRIYLTVNGVMVDSLDNCQQSTTMNALMSTNRHSNDFNRQTLLNGMGFQIESNAQPQSGALSLQAEYSTNYATINGANNQAINNQVVIAQNVNQQSGMIRLRDLLGFLRAKGPDGQYVILPALPDLKLEIEWNTDNADYFLDPAQAGGITPNLSPMQPMLVYDELLNVSPEQVVSVINYDQRLTERFNVPVKANDAFASETSFRSQAFKAKYLKRLALVNLPSSQLADASKWLSRTNRSVAQKAEKIQLVVNSRSLFPGDGISSPIVKQHMFNMSYGQLNLPISSTMQNVRDDRNNMLTTLASPLVGQYSILGTKVERVIDSLRVEYQRKYGDTASGQEAFTLLLVGDVSRTMTIKDNMVRLNY